MDRRFQDISRRNRIAWWLGEALPRVVFAVAIGLALACAFTGCSESTSSKLVGTWERTPIVLVEAWDAASIAENNAGNEIEPPREPQRISFDRHGNFANNFLTYGMQPAGHWTATSDTLTLDPLLATPSTMDIAFSGRDEFTIIRAGEVTTYRRTSPTK